MKTQLLLFLCLLMPAVSFSQGHGENDEALPQRENFLDIDSYRYILRAIEDFEVDTSVAIPYYVHERRAALAIHAGKLAYRNGFARANAVFTQAKAGTFDLVLVTLAETDGESEYRVLLNNTVIGNFKNPETSEDYKEVTFRIPGITLNPEDVISVESNAVTNGKIPERDGTAFSRGRWIGVVLQ